MLEEIQDVINKRINQCPEKPTPFCAQQLDTYMVQLNLPGGFYHFMVDPRRNLSHSGLLYLDADFRGQGLGRMLVETREAICNDLESNSIIINHTDNHSFWAHLGYRPATSNTKKTIQKLDILSINPHFKYV
tara:strand:+ start:85 stop:480 length:396 start_codon:yes stop_codon:yes gene_type:complete